MCELCSSLTEYMVAELPSVKRCSLAVAVKS
jgi:hypothetical protein